MLSRLSAWFLTKLKNGMFGSFFTSYDKANKNFRNASKERERRGLRKYSIRRRVAKAFEKSIFSKIFPQIANFLLRTAVHDFGAMFFAMGLFASLLYPLRSYVYIASFHVSLDAFVIGIIIAVISLPFLFSSKSFSQMILTNRFVHWLCIDFIGFNEETFREAADIKKRSSPSISFFVGAALGIISYLLSPLTVFVTIIVFFLALEVLNTPETGIIFIIFALPFATGYVMAAMSLYVAFAYTLKCIVGKRTFKFELLDLAIVFLLFACLYGGLASLDIASSIEIALIDISLILVFTLVSNLIRSKEWFKRCIHAMLVSTFIISTLSIVEYIFASIKPDFGIFEEYVLIKDRISLTFDSSDALAIYLAIAVPFILLTLISAKKRSGRFGAFILFALDVTALVMTFSRVGYIAAIVALFMTLIIYNRNFVYLLFVFLGAIPILVYTLPMDVKASISSVGAFETTSHAYRLDIFAKGIEIIKRYPFGVGFGKNAFNEAYISLFGGEGIGYMENLFLQITASLGIIGVLLICITLVIFLRLAFSYCAKTEHRVHRSVGCLGFSSATAIIAAGYNSYVFADKTIFLLFIMMMAFTFAYAKIERINDKPTSALVNISASSIDIELAHDASNDTVQKRKYVRSPKKASKKNREHRVEEMINRSELISVMGETETEEASKNDTRY